MRQEVLSVERRWRWTDDEKLAVVSEVGINGATVADVAQGHDVTRQHIYQWLRELRAKGMWNDREDTPDARHRGEDRALLSTRHELYQAARARHPARWSGNTRSWDPVGSVWLNPERPMAGHERDAA